MSEKKTNTGLANYCIKQLGLPYWWRNVWTDSDRFTFGTKKETIPKPIHSNRFHNPVWKKSA